MSLIRRATSRTRVQIALDPFAGAEGYSAEVRTGEPFLDHLLATLARHAGFGLRVEATTPLRSLPVEDLAITLGLALADEIPDACQRYGEATVVVADALVQVVLDLGGPFYYQGPLPDPRYDRLLRTFAENARLTLQLRVLRGHDRGHIIDAAFKALGLALHRAMAPLE
jgi:imidazoleglycerol-phosphate dehydratase